MVTQKKYKFLRRTRLVNGFKLRQIVAVRDFGSVKAGDLGGFIEKEDTLSHHDTCWIDADSFVYGDSLISRDSQIKNSTLNSVEVVASHVFDSTLKEGYLEHSVVALNSHLQDITINHSLLAEVRGNNPLCVRDSCLWLCSTRLPRNIPRRAFIDTAYSCSGPESFVFQISPIGSEAGQLVIAPIIENEEWAWGVIRGCFTGTLAEFTAKVREVHGKRSAAGKQYLSFIEWFLAHYRLPAGSKKSRTLKPMARLQQRLNYVAELHPEATETLKSIETRFKN